MMTRFQGIKFIVLFILALLWTMDYGLWTASAEEAVSLQELLSNPDKYEAKTITYQGEAVGDIMQRGDYFWINVLDGPDAIGVWAPARFRPLIKFLGSYTSQGDYIKVTGRFNQRCKEHSGELDIHAQDIEIIKRGKFIFRKVEKERKNLAIILSLGALCLLILLVSSNVRLRKLKASPAKKN